MNSVGIDISKGKSMVAIMRPFGEVVASPYEISHSAKDLRGLIDFINGLDGETRVVMEYTGAYYTPVAHVLYEAGIFVSVVNAILIHNYNGNSIRRVKTDKKDAIKIATYGLERWVDLVRYVPEDDLRRTLKIYNRQYDKYLKMKTTLSNNLISLLDQTFPDIQDLLTSAPRKSDGHVKWIDFISTFWHCECVCGLSPKAFKIRYLKWCKKNGYLYNESKAEKIYIEACGNVGMLPKNEFTKNLIVQAAAQVTSIAGALMVLTQEMNRLASQLPEYSIVMDMFDVGEKLGPQLIAEIGDVRRFMRKQSLVAYAGIDAPPYQSGTFESHSRKISKRGSPRLRKALFQVMICTLQQSKMDDPIFQFLDKKRKEGKHYYVYMTAGSNKFLRIYYARVKAYLEQIVA